jgi:hypothetical protein
MALGQVEEIDKDIVVADWRGDDELVKLFWPNDGAARQS